MSDANSGTDGCRLYRESLLSLCGFEGSPERLGEPRVFHVWNGRADLGAAELLAADIGQPLDKQVAVYYDLFRTVHWYVPRPVKVHSANRQHTNTRSKLSMSDRD